MSFRVKPMVQGLALAFGGLAVVGTTAYAQTPPAPTQQQLERITITGSNIRRTDQETVAPVEIITREQIERSGQPPSLKCSEAFRPTPAAASARAFPTASPRARPVSRCAAWARKRTLVLLNGRRVAGYGFAQNLQDTFVDLNSIPSSAVERIEVLKDGASAIYGSDAIAGVVNIILRRDYKGIEASGDVGSSKAPMTTAPPLLPASATSARRNLTCSACSTTTSVTRSCCPTPSSARTVTIETKTAAATSRV